VLFRRTVQLPVRGKRWEEVASGSAQPGAESALEGMRTRASAWRMPNYLITSQAIGAICSTREAACPPKWHAADLMSGYIESFLADGFDSRRHECANAAMSVHNLSHERSRELYDLTMLEVRRLVYDVLPPRQPITAGRLLGTRAVWMTRYAPLMSASEFSKFVVLMRDLAPYVLLIIDPANKNSHRLDRSAQVGRKNIELVLNGDPSAKPLF